MNNIAFQKTLHTDPEKMSNMETDQRKPLV